MAEGNNVLADFGAGGFNNNNNNNDAASSQNLRGPDPNLEEPDNEEPVKKTTYTNGSIIEDGKAYVRTLTGFSDDNNLLENFIDIAPEERFSDHACIVYAADSLATFNIAMQAIHAAGKPYQLHKFPMNSTVSVNESDDDYRARLENIAKFTRILLDRGIDTVVLQEVVPSPEEANPSDQAPVPFDGALNGIYPNKLRHGELAILTTCTDTTDTFVPRKTIGEDLNQPATGLYSKTNPLQKRIHGIQCPATKQVIYNLHIPGTQKLPGTSEPNFDQRRVNMFKVMESIVAEIRRDRRTADYEVVFVGDFNCPMVDYDQEAFYNSIPIPFEIHTTRGNEGFSYVDHNHTREPKNIDCLVKFPAVGGSREPTPKKPRAPLRPRPIAPNTISNAGTENTNETRSTISSLNTNARREAIDVDPKFPTLLRIGSGGRFDEYINVNEKTFTSDGSFNTHRIGGQEEIQNLYGIVGADQLQDLQRAFGVKQFGGQPPILELLKNNCKKDYVSTVVSALENRVKTLKSELGTLSGTTQQGIKTAFINSLVDLIEKLEKLPDTACPGEEEEPREPEREAGGEASTGCPCLDDLDLLRNLIFLLVNLLGVASPEVKAQLDEIRLDDILGLLEDGNSPTASVRLQEILEMVSKLEAAAPDGEKGADVQGILEQIWIAIMGDGPDDEPPPEGLTVEMLIDKINGVLRNMVDDINETKENYENLDEAYDVLQEEKETLEARLKECLEAPNPLLDQVKRASQTATDAAQFAETAAAAKAEADAKVASLQAQLDALQRTQTNSAAEKAANVAEIAELEGQVAAAQAEVDAANKRAQDCEAALAAAQAKVDELNTLLTNEKSHAVNLANEINRLQGEIDATKKTIDAKEKTIQQLVSDKNKSNTTSSTKLAEITNELAKQTTTVQELHTKLAGYESTLASLNTQLEEANTKLAEATARANAAESMTGELKAASEAKIAELTSKLANVEAQLASLDKEQGELIAATEKRIAEFNRLTAQAAAVEPALRAKIAELEAKVVEAESAAAASAKTAEEKAQEAAALQAQVKECTEKFEKEKADHAAEKERIEGEKSALIAQLTAVENQLREVERKVEDSTGQLSQKNIQLGTLTSEVETLKDKISALTASGANRDQAFTELDRQYKSQIESLKQQLVDVQASKTSELDAKNADYKQQLDAKNTNIQRLEDALATAKREAESAVTAAEAKASGDVASAQRDANTKVAEAEAKATAAETNRNQKIAEVSATVSAKNAEISRLTAELDAEKAARDALVTNIQQLANPGSTVTNPTLQPIKGRIDALQARLGQETAEKAALQGQVETLTKTIRTKNDIIAAKNSTISNITKVGLSYQAELDELRNPPAAAPNHQALISQLNAVNSTVSKLQETIQATSTLNQTPATVTNGRLNTLLGVILVDDDLQKAAKDYFTTGNQAELNKLSAKKTDAGILSPELCDFYTYLYGIVNLQYKKLPSRFGTDILSSFKNPPANDVQTIKALLREIAMIFQAFFIMGETTTIPSDLTLSADVPILSKFLLELPAQPLKDEVSRNSFAREVTGLGFLGQLALIPKAGTQKVALTKLGTNFIQDFVEDNQRHILPLSVLAVKLIQLLHDDLNAKYADIRTRCGVPADFKANSAPALVPLVATEGAAGGIGGEQKGGSGSNNGDDSYIEFEELEF